MKPIGGYLELELEKNRVFYHSEAMSFKNRLRSLLYILQLLKPSVVYVPFYTNDGLFEPFYITGTKIIYYAINNQLEPVDLPDLKSDECFLYINYFDLKRSYAEELSAKFGDRLIVDCSQAYFMKGNDRSWFYNCCRRFFGLPDGSYLYCPVNYREQAVVSSRISALPKNRIAIHLHGQDGSRMSKMTEYVLSTIDVDKVIRKRRSNFYYLQSVFSDKAFLSTDSDCECVPMAFPAIFENKISRKRLSVQNVFVPIYWKDVIRRNNDDFTVENNLAHSMLPLPVDHRYGLEDMVRMEIVIKSIK